MLPIAPLMIEHRLIERIIALLRPELEFFAHERRADVGFVGDAIDFIRTYADQCHHGKEEDILFRDLATKPLAPEHRRVLEHLVAEHKYARTVVRTLAAARDRYLRGSAHALAEIVTALHELLTFYPGHIEREDRQFFLPCMQYFTAEEQAAMLERMREFDREMIHRQYRAVVEQWEEKTGKGASAPKGVRP